MPNGTAPPTAYRQAHPLPMALAHGVHLLTMLALALTGLYIHAPFLGAPMRVVLETHFIAMYVLLVALAARAWYALVGRSALGRDTRETGWDLRNFLPQRENRGRLLETARYYLFLRPTRPATAKYDPLQKLAYWAIAGLLLLQALTGFALYEPARSLAAAGPFLGFVTAALGGLMGVRVLHYLGMWALVVITMAHVYLATAEDTSSLALMFLRRETIPPQSAEETRQAPAA